MANKNLRKLIKMGILPESKKAWDAQVKRMTEADLEDFDIRVGSLEETDPGLYDELLSYVTMENGTEGLRQLGEDFYGAEPVQKKGIRGKKNTPPEKIESNVPETTAADKDILEDAPAGDADDEYLRSMGFDPSKMDAQARADNLESLRAQGYEPGGKKKAAKKATGKQAGKANESDAKKAARAMLEQSRPQAPQEGVVSAPTDMNFTETVGDMSFPMFSPEGMPGVVMADMADLPQMPTPGAGMADDIDAMTALDYAPPPNEPPPPPVMPFDPDNMARVTAQGPFVSGSGTPMLDDMGTYGTFGDQPSLLSDLASGVEDTGMTPMRGPGFSNPQEIATPGDMLTQFKNDELVGGTVPANPPPAEPYKPPVAAKENMFSDRSNFPLTSRFAEFMKARGLEGMTRGLSVFPRMGDFAYRNPLTTAALGLGAGAGAAWAMSGGQPQATPEQVNAMEERRRLARQRAEEAAGSMMNIPQLGQ